MAPIVGSTITTVSGESEARSGSAMTPSFICRRTAKSGSLAAVGAEDRRAARIAEAGARMVRDGRPEIGWQVRAVYAASCAGSSGPEVGPRDQPPSSAPSDDHTQLTRPGAGGRGREGGQELRRAEAQLLGDDRGVGLDDDPGAVDPDDPARPGDARHPLGDELVEGRHRPREAELVLQPETARRIRQEVPDPNHRATASAHPVIT